LLIFLNKNDMISVHRPALIALAPGSIQTKEILADKLQLALMLEFSTIPPYLTAMYSMQDNGSYAYQLIRSVVLEEMLHMNLVSNLLLSIGEKPQFVSNKYFPSYPTHLPGQDAAVTGGPLLQLMPVSIPVIENVFMVVEEPARRNSPAQDINYMTIAQFYLAIWEGFKTVDEKMRKESKHLFVKNDLQKPNYYFGSGGGHPVIVTDLKTAKMAIDEIVEQGEGAPAASGAPTEPNENFGTKDAYAYRSDGTYGPILGAPSEQSHYYKFMEVAKGNYPIGAVYPMLPNPTPESFKGNAWAVALSEIFNGCYSIMVAGLEKAFSSTGPDDPFFSVVFTMMQSVIPVLSVQMMQLPLTAGADPSVGPNAGPTFVLAPIGLDKLIAKVQACIDEPPSQDNITGVRATLTVVKSALCNIQEKVKGKNYSFL